MKINLVTSLNRQNILECIRLWSLQKTLKKRDFYVKIIDIAQEDTKVHPGKDFVSSLFPNYISLENPKDLARELDNGGLCIVTGMDVWKSKDINKMGKAVLLKNSKNPNKYAYNVGVAGTQYSFLEKAIVKRYFSEFQKITVCKEEDKKQLSNFYDGDIEVLCDNVFLLRMKEYEEICKAFKSFSDYIVLDIEREEEGLVQVAKEAARETGLKVLCLDSDTAKKHGFQWEHIVSPQKFLGVIKDAKYVITNSEKSTLFACIYNRPLLYGKRKAEDSYLEDILNKVRLSGNIISDAEEYQDISQCKLWNGYALHKRLGELKKEAYACLDKITGRGKRPDEYVDAPTGILKKDCCGCYACEEVCPVTAIQMKEDKKGYYYPVVDSEKCISCQLCKKSCVIQKPRLIEHKESFPIVIAAYHKDLEVRRRSTSGAMFPSFARYVIEEKLGYVAGAKYDEDMNVISSVGSTMEEVQKFYGSKYSKSLLDGSYKRIKELLDQGEYVLFSGLPCECSGLRAFLRKDYDKLFVCEIICHAAPSAKVFKAYVSYLEKKFGSKVTHVTFRQKKNGWQAHQTSMVVDFKDREPLRVVNRTNNYYRIFANDLIARESCTNCRFTRLNRAGDITIGDFWGVQDIHPEMYDNQGTSFLMIHNARGLELWNQVKDDFTWMESSVEKVFKKNHSEPISYKIDQEEFFHRMEQGEPINQLLEEFNDLKK